MAAALAFALGCAAAVLYLPHSFRPASWPRSVRKTLPVALFAMAAALAGAAPLLTAALILGALGDLALSRDGQGAFLAGMVAFALAHLAYIGLFVPSGAALAAIPWALAAALLGLGLSTHFWLMPHAGRLLWPVRAYVVVILAMGLAAAALPGDMWLARLGAALFILSDLILSIEVFRVPSDNPRRKWLGKAVWSTYIAAQAGLLLGLGPV